MRCLSLCSSASTCVRAQQSQPVKLGDRGHGLSIGEADALRLARPAMRGLPVLRRMMNPQREFNPQAFHVFGPKIPATRGSYDDKGLESRFLTEEMGSRKLRFDIA